MKTNCKWCTKEFNARPADLKRGWAQFCSKSCKARHQEKRTGQHSDYVTRRQYARDIEEGNGVPLALSDMAEGNVQ